MTIQMVSSGYCALRSPSLFSIRSSKPSFLLRMTYAKQLNGKLMQEIANR